MIDFFFYLLLLFLIICCKFYNNRNASCNSSFPRATLFIPFFLFFSLSSPSWKCPASSFQTTNCCHYFIFWRSHFFRWFCFRFDSGNRDLSLLFFFPVSVCVHSLSYILSSWSLLTSVWYIFPYLKYSYLFFFPFFFFIT